MNWNELLNSVVVAARISFSDLIKSHKKEGLYAFILYTDADCYTILPSANTIEKYEEKVSRIDISDPKRMASYKWYIGEWAYEGWQSDAFEAICQKLGDASEAAFQDGTIVEFKQEVHACMVKALSVLDEEGFFEPIRKNVVLFISSTDYDESIALENASAKELNDLEVYDAFLRRYEV